MTYDPATFAAKAAADCAAVLAAQPAGGALRLGMWATGTTTSTPEGALTGQIERTYHWDTPSHAELASSYFATQAEAEAFAALFPKTAKARVTQLGFGGGNFAHFVTFGNIVLHANGVNGGRNETGIARLLRIVNVARKNGLPIEMLSHWVSGPHMGKLDANQYPTADAALAAVA